MKKLKFLIIIIFVNNIFNCSIFAKNTKVDDSLIFKIKIESIKTSRAFLRYGPGKNYPVQWEFIKKNWPIKVLDKLGNWKKIKTVDGSDGWMHTSQLSVKKTSLTLYDDYLRRRPLRTSKKLAFLKKNVLVKVLDCKKYWCKIELDNNKFKGWYLKSYLWGFRFF